MSIRILLADDHPMVLKGLSFFLKTQDDIDIVGEVNNGVEALKVIGEMKPDVVLMDLSMPVLDGIEATKIIRRDYPQTKVLILTSFSDQDHVLPAIKAGASGYQLKDIEPEELVKTIRAVHQGQTQLHPQATTQLLNHVTHQGTPSDKQHLEFNSLTPREKDVLFQITLGKGNKEIASDLFITEKTVKTHVSNILSKLELHDRTQAAVKATKEKWFSE